MRKGGRKYEEDILEGTKPCILKGIFDLPQIFQEGTNNPPRIQAPSRSEEGDNHRTLRCMGEEIKT